MGCSLSFFSQATAFLPPGHPFRERDAFWRKFPFAPFGDFNFLKVWYNCSGFTGCYRFDICIVHLG
jgi:hypothetical protein